MPIKKGIWDLHKLLNCSMLQHDVALVPPPVTWCSSARLPHLHWGYPPESPLPEQSGDVAGDRSNEYGWSVRGNEEEDRNDFKIHVSKIMKRKCCLMHEKVCVDVPLEAVRATLNVDLADFTPRLSDCCLLTQENDFAQRSAPDSSFYTFSFLTSFRFPGNKMHFLLPFLYNFVFHLFHLVLFDSESFLGIRCPANCHNCVGCVQI